MRLASHAWEAAVLPLNYTRMVSLQARILLDFSAILNVNDGTSVTEYERCNTTAEYDC